MPELRTLSLDFRLPDDYAMRSVCAQLSWWAQMFGKSLPELVDTLDEARVEIRLRSAPDSRARTAKLDRCG